MTNENSEQGYLQEEDKKKLIKEFEEFIEKWDIEIIPDCDTYGDKTIDVYSNRFRAEHIIEGSSIDRNTVWEG